MVRLFFCLVVGSVFLPRSAQAQQLLACETGEIHFTSDAPLELIQASTSELKGLIDTGKNIFAYTLNVGSFKGFNSALQQEHFYENYMETAKYPKADFQGKIIESIDYNVNGTHQIRAKGILNIHGVQQERIIPCSLVIADGTATVSTTFTVLLKDHKISIPKIVNQKIAEEISVDLKAEFSEK